MWPEPITKDHGFNKLKFTLAIYIKCGYVVFENNLKL